MTEIQRAIAAAAQHATAVGQGRRAVIPAPVGGLNTLDPEAAMDPIYATRLDNWWPDRGRVVTRAGSVVRVNISGESANIGTLHVWASGSSQKLLGFSDSTLYDLSAITSATSLVTTGITSGRWSAANMNGHAVFCNGVDAPLRIDGDGAVAEHGLSGTGLTPANLETVTVHRGRLYFSQKDSSKVWYGAADAVTGALTSFDVGGVVPEGGRVRAIGSVSLDTGAGPDDLLAIWLSRGHVLLYHGGDPAGSSWALQGTYLLPPVIGDRPLVKLGGDLVAITDAGYVPLLQFMRSGREQRSLALSDKIAPTVAEAVALHRNDTGWEAVYYPPKNWLIFAVPGPTGIQHVMNTTSRAWCRFVGMTACSWAVFKDRLFFGCSGGRLFEAAVGGTDYGTRIHRVARCAFNYLGSPYDKRFALMRPHLLNEGATADVAFGLAVDFAEDLPDLHAVALADEGTQWDTALWDAFSWSAGRTEYRRWSQSRTAGAAVSPVIECYSSSGDISWFSTDVQYDQVAGTLISP